MTPLYVSTSVVSMSLLLAPFAATICAASANQAEPQPVTILNIRIAPVLVPVFDTILASSPAFAAQCERIAQARSVRVIVIPVMAASTTSRGIAQTTMRRFTAGALVAVVEMPVPLTTIEYAELFGHEFEHILEQIDRVDLAALAGARGGVTRLWNGAYETRRARKAGQTIADEIARPRADAIGLSGGASGREDLTRFLDRPAARAVRQ